MQRKSQIKTVPTKFKKEMPKVFVTNKVNIKAFDYAGLEDRFQHTPKKYSNKVSRISKTGGKQSKSIKEGSWFLDFTQA